MKFSARRALAKKKKGLDEVARSGSAYFLDDDVLIMKVTSALKAKGKNIAFSGASSGEVLITTAVEPDYTEFDMNSDQTAIQTAYGAAIQQLYATLFNSYVEAGGDAAQQQLADQHFTAGLGFARQSRDRALALVA